MPGFFVDNEFPARRATGIDPFTLIKLDILEETETIIPSSIRIYVRGMLAYDGSTGTFSPQHDTPNSSISPTNVGGLNGYHIEIGNNGPYLMGYVSIEIRATGSLGGVINDSILPPCEPVWYFVVNEYSIAPFATNIIPAPNSVGSSTSSLIEFDVLDEQSGVKQSSLKIYVKNILAYDGYTDVFYSPYNGSSSSVVPTMFDGYDGYHVTIECTEELIGSVAVKVDALDLDTCAAGVWCPNQAYIRWGYISGPAINTVYFGDGYGLKAADSNDIAGESQDIVRVPFTTQTMPPIRRDEISFLNGEFINGASYVAATHCGADFGSMYGTFNWGDDLWGRFKGAIWGEFNWGSMDWQSMPKEGVTVIKSEATTNYFMDGYKVAQAQLTDSGTLYVINEHYNQVYVFYGAHNRDGYKRIPDYIYDAYSTPPIVPGKIQCMHVVSNASILYDEGSRVYVGTPNGMTRIETYDKHNDGYGAGFDGYGRSYSYGIHGAGMDYDVLGGDVPNVVAIGSDEQTNLVLVATFDGYNRGGLSQITLEGNRRVVFFDDSYGAIPSNDIRNIFGKGY